jgi:hypothetical protein
VQLILLYPSILYREREFDERFFVEMGASPQPQTAIIELTYREDAICIISA